MNLWRISLTGLLASALLLSLVSCGGKDNSTSFDGASSDGASSELVLKDKTLDWMAIWPMNPEDGRPELKMFREKYGGKVVDHLVTVDERLEAITAAAMSDDCPDITGFETELLPAGFKNGLYRHIDDLIDINGFGWRDLKPLLDLYQLDGKHYVPTPSVADGGVLIYNKQTIKQYNLEDPRELFRQGKWTWDKMLEMMKAFTDPNDTQGGKFGRYGLDGWNFAYTMHTTCGTALVSMNNSGNLENNLMDAGIERYMNFVRDMKQSGVLFPRWDNDGQIVENSITTGQTLFFDTGMWAYPNYTIRQYALGEDASYVPYPRDPASDTYYRTAGVDPHMVFGGAQNLDGVRAWLDCRILVNQDPELKKDTEAIWLDPNPEVGCGWNEDDVDFYYEMTDLSKFNPVLDWSNGLGVEGVSGYDITNAMWMEDKPWATVREEFIPMFNTAIDNINNS